MVCGGYAGEAVMEQRSNRGLLVKSLYEWIDDGEWQAWQRVMHCDNGDVWLFIRDVQWRVVAAVRLEKGMK